MMFRVLPAIDHGVVDELLSAIGDLRPLPELYVFSNNAAFVGASYLVCSFVTAYIFKNTASF